MSRFINVNLFTPALLVVFWVGTAQLATLILRKEKDLNVYLSVFYFAFISYFYYAIIYGKIFSVIFHFYGIFMEGSSYQAFSGGLRTASGVARIFTLIGVDVVTRLLMRSKLIKSFRRSKDHPALSEAIDYLLSFTAVSFLLCLILVSVFIILYI